MYNRRQGNRTRRVYTPCSCSRAAPHSWPTWFVCPYVRLSSLFFSLPCANLFLVTSSLVLDTRQEIRAHPTSGQKRHRIAAELAIAGRQRRRLGGCGAAPIPFCALVGREKVGP